MQDHRAGEWTGPSSLAECTVRHPEFQSARAHLQSLKPALSSAEVARNRGNGRSTGEDTGTDAPPIRGKRVMAEETRERPSLAAVVPDPAILWLAGSLTGSPEKSRTD